MRVEGVCWLLVCAVLAGSMYPVQASEEQINTFSSPRHQRQGGAVHTLAPSVSCPHDLHSLPKQPVRRSHTFQVKSRRNQQENDTDSFYYQTYERSPIFSPNDDPVLFELINLSARLANGQERNGLWKDFIWGLGRWMIERSWYGASSELLPIMRSAEGIDVIALTSVPEHHLFLERLVAIQKTFDEYWLVSGETTYGRVLQHFRETIKNSIQGVVGQVANDSENDNSLVVANTVRVVRSVLTVVKGYYNELDKSSLASSMPLWLEQVRVMGKAADGMISLISLARTPKDLQLVMANLKMMMRWLDGEYPFHTLDPRGLLGLKSFSKLLQTPFDMGFVPKQELGKPPIFRGIPVAMEQLSQKRYQHLLFYTLLLLRGRITGLLPVDKSWMANHVAYQDITLYDLPEGGVGALAADVMRVSMLSQAQQVFKGVAAAPRLNATLFELLFSPAGESIETFYLLRMLRELEDMCVSHKDAECVEREVVLERFMASSDVRQGIEAMATQLANVGVKKASQIPLAPTMGASLGAAQERLRKSVLPYGEKCLIPVDTLGRLIGAMQSSLQPQAPLFLPTPTSSAAIKP